MMENQQDAAKHPISAGLVDVFDSVELIKNAVAQAYIEAATADLDQVTRVIGERMEAMRQAEDNKALAERTQSLDRVAENIAICQGLHEAANHFAARRDPDKEHFLRGVADLFAHYVVVDIAAASRIAARVQNAIDGKLLARLTATCVSPEIDRSGAVH